MTHETYPPALSYNREHDWVRAEGDEATFGITWFAQNSLGDIVYATLPEAGEPVTEGAPYGELESVKTVTQVFAPVSGEVLEINETLQDDPQLINEDCYGDGWLVRVRLSAPAQIAKLMDADAYRAFLEQA
jgi:glycine cleavage system H protein